MQDENRSMHQGGGEVAADAAAVLRACLERALGVAERMQREPTAAPSDVLGPIAAKVEELAATGHAARGALLTVVAYKACFPRQDARMHMADHEGGFSARSYDSSVTVPFLREYSLPTNVESHWLTRALAISGPWIRGSTLKLSPRKAGTLLLDIVNDLEDAVARGGDASAVSFAITVLVLAGLVAERNRRKVDLTRPKNLSIDELLRLLRAHFARRYEKNGPRLPQLAAYAIYQCMVGHLPRYEHWQLEKLGRMKAADRKAGTIGDVVVLDGGRRIEAAEVKHDIPVDVGQVREAMEKVKAGSVERYLILSTAGVSNVECEEVGELCAKFRRANGCEIIPDDLLDTLGRYLRLLESPNAFIDKYVSLVEADDDTGYEHRRAWNELCEQAATGS